MVPPITQGTSQAAAVAVHINKLLRWLLKRSSRSAAEEITRTLGTTGIKMRVRGTLGEIAHDISNKPETDRQQLIINLLRIAPNLHIKKYAEGFDVDFAALKHQVYSLRLAGALPFPRKPNAITNYTEEQLRKAVNEALDGTDTLANISERHGIPPRTLDYVSADFREVLGLPRIPGHPMPTAMRRYLTTKAEEDS